MGDVNQTSDFRSRAAAWLFSQGTSTVLLLALCVGLYVQVPRVADRVQQSQETQINRLAESFDKDQDRDVKILEKILDAAGVGDASPDATGSRVARGAN